MTINSNPGVQKPPIADVLTHYGATFIPEGNRWRPMKCPFHEDRTASASVHTGKQFFKCFACAIFGDGYDIVMWKGDARDFLGAVSFIESVLGDSFTGLSQQLDVEPGSKTRRRVFDENPEPVKGQRAILPSRLRRKPFSGA